MNYQKLTRGYMLTVLAIGSACFAVSLFYLPFNKVDVPLVLLSACAVIFGPRIIVQIPQLKSHISVSDTLVFLALILYGGSVAIVLAALEALLAARRFCNRSLTVAFNAATMAVSTSAIVAVLYVSDLLNEDTLHGHPDHLRDFLIALSAIALTQFVVNTLLASFYDALMNSLPFWETWASKYIWTFFTYFVGAAGAGGMVQAIDYAGFGVLIAVMPVTLFLFLAYRMYLKNVEMSVLQAKEAEHHANALEERTSALRESEERFRSAFNYAPIGIGLVTSHGRWIRVNRALCRILGYSSDEFLNMNYQSMIHPDDLGVTLVRTHELIAGKFPNCQIENRFVNKAGDTVWTSWSVSSASDLLSENPTLIFQIQDITDRKFAEHKLQHEATHDLLTGLPNRAYFMARLAEALGKAKHDSKYKVSILFIDLDRFKYVNDSLGHVVGDELLKGISERLRECMRPPDIIARLGGDEFTILVQGRYYSEQVTDIAERIQRRFDVPFDLNGHEVYSSASIGILHASERHLTSEDMMRDADTAMYQAKRSGKARHEVFDEAMHTVAKETLQLETDLRRAVEKEDFTVVYQPIFSLESMEFDGLEALVRWNHPEHGDVPPARFVPLAEEIGLIDTLGEQIMLRACREIGSVYADLNYDAARKLSVNLSSKQFARTDLVERIKKILDETGFPPYALKLEITESVFFEYQERAIEMLHQLRELGIDIDIDDFGTGYSNLSYLIRLPISTLKIDRSFINPITEDGANTEIVRTILAMANNLGLAVVAEGIESRAQLELLKQLGCERGQGFLFARPMTFPEIRKYLLKRFEVAIPNPSFNDVSIVSTLQ